MGDFFMKSVVLDTNVLLDRPFEQVLESFTEPTKIILPHVVLKELDTFKKGFEMKNEYARAATRFLDSLRVQGHLQEGVPHGEHIIVVDIPLAELDMNKPDYQIIRTASEHQATLISQDINERVVADAVGIQAEGFTPTDVNVNELYTGVIGLHLSDEEIEEWGSTRQLLGKREGILHNQFVELTDENEVYDYGIYKEEGVVQALKYDYRAFGVKPKTDKNRQVIQEQKFLMHMLLDPSIQFVTAIGPSGCGKTLLSIAAALEQTMNQELYNKITVMRPLIAVGDDIGYLPGDKLEKLEPWMGSTFDSLDYLLDGYDLKDGNPQATTREKVQELINYGWLELEAMAHIRGRSMPHQFIIIDDAQNLTQQQAATIITRAGDDTKVVFLGDLSEKQIDNHRLTPNSNGLAYVIDRLKGQDIVGHITMKQVVRSRLAQLGVELL